MNSSGLEIDVSAVVLAMNRIPNSRISLHDHERVVNDVAREQETSTCESYVRKWSL